MVAYRRNMPQGRQEKGEEMDKIRVAAVQMVSGVSPETNVAAMKRLVARAAEQGADWVLLPEYWVLMGANDTGKLALAEPLGGGRFQTALSETAKECGVVLFGNRAAAKPRSGQGHEYFIGVRVRRRKDGAVPQNAPLRFFRFGRTLCRSRYHPRRAGSAALVGRRHAGGGRYLLRCPLSRIFPPPTAV